MDYNKWAEEYFNDAKQLNKTIAKYEAQLKLGQPINREHINSQIANLKSIQNYLMNVGNEIKERGLKYQNKKN